MDERYNSIQEGYAFIKHCYEDTSKNKKNMEDSFKLIWENIKANDYSTAAAYASNLATQALETAETYQQLAKICEITTRTVDG